MCVFNYKKNKKTKNPKPPSLMRLDLSVFWKTSGMAHPCGQLEQSPKEVDWECLFACRCSSFSHPLGWKRKKRSEGMEGGYGDGAMGCGRNGLAYFWAWGAYNLRHQRGLRLISNWSCGTRTHKPSASTGTTCSFTLPPSCCSLCWISSSLLTTLIYMQSWDTVVVLCPPCDARDPFAWDLGGSSRVKPSFSQDGRFAIFLLFWGGGIGGGGTLLKSRGGTPKIFAWERGGWWAFGV